MYDGDYYRLMAEYGTWMNARLFEVCQSIPDGDRKRDLGAFFGSLHATLDHILFGDRAWMARFTDRDYGLKPMGELLFDDFEALTAARQEMDRDILDWVSDLDSTWLAAPFSYYSGAYDRDFTLPAWVCVTHMFNHQTHHRGQATTLVSQLGYQPGITDLPLTPALQA